MRRGSRTLLAFLAVALATISLDARANGRFPATNAITFDPSDPARVYIRTTFGLLVSTDGGHAWDLVCERALGFSGPEDPTIGVFKDGAVAVTLFEGLSVSHDHACNFSFVQGALDKKIFVDVAVRKTAPSAGVAVTSGYANRTDDAGNALFFSEVFVTSDAGNTWERRGAPIDPNLMLETVDYSPARANRIFISAVQGSGIQVSGALLVSDDGGLTFVRRSIPLIPKKERAPYIAALSPTEPDTVFVRVLGAVDQPARLLVTKDAGKTWSALLTTTAPMKGFAISDDGKTLFAGSPKDGLWVGSASTGRFEKTSPVEIQCLAYVRGELWACSNEANGFIGGVSRDNGKTWEPRAHLRDVRAPLACPRSSRTAQLCNADWPKQRATLGIDSASERDGGSALSLPAPSSDAGPSANAEGSPRRGCACDMAIGTHVGRNASSALAFVVGTLWLLRIRRRQRP